VLEEEYLQELLVLLEVLLPLERQEVAVET
jgi:hypothetical protein